MDKISCGGFYLGDGLSMEEIDGKPILKAQSGGDDSGVIVINMADVGEASDVTCDYTVKEILDYLIAGRFVVAKYASKNYSTGGVLFWLLPVYYSYEEDEGEVEGEVKFALFDPSYSSSLSAVYGEYTEDDDFWHTEYPG